MTIKGRLKKLEQQARDAKPERRVEMILPWPGGGSIRLKVTPEVVANIKRIYGAA